MADTPIADGTPETNPESSSIWRRLAVPVVLLVALSAGGLAMCGLPGDSLDDGEGIAGIYVVNGVDPGGVEYSGTVTIVPLGGDDFDVQWIVTGTIQRGTGLLRGDRFSVEWETVTAARGDSSGSAEYTVGTDGVLRGTRTVDGVAESGTEEIFPEP
ncbi:MAG: hypothetical protein QNJ12_02225 [Ilumatobacter sp.]|uniref:hypothetical protein n=1 Tax=Ilumatobacter sp. TaxID=1967498 RepID=UPI00262C46DE|nr:hypothetical protein [Ilumatobacter sp.]MDJ0767573.1 hypothetical protein [Ilumatobacter sp.]